MRKFSLVRAPARTVNHHHNRTGKDVRDLVREVDEGGSPCSAGDSTTLRVRVSSFQSVVAMPEGTRAPNAEA